MVSRQRIGRCRKLAIGDVPQQDGQDQYLQVARTSRMFVHTMADHQYSNCYINYIGMHT